MTAKGVAENLSNLFRILHLTAWRDVRNRPEAEICQRRSGKRPSASITALSY